MKASYITLTAAGIILVFAACHSWAGSTEPVAVQPAHVDRDTIAFVEGTEAEPPALPPDLPMPKPASAAAKEVKHSAATPPKESALKTATPQARPPLHRIPKETVTAEKPMMKRGAPSAWND
jgi:hypothetical protein